MDNKPVSDDNSGKTPNQPTNWFEEVFFFIIAGLTFAIWEPTKLLLRRTYTTSDSNSSEPNLLNIALGVLISLGSGIGVGYQLGWVGDANFWHWVPWGLGTAAAVFVYGWTIVYLLTLKYAFKLSNKLWAHVNIDAKEYRSWSGDAPKTGTNPAWFSKFLMFVGFVGVGLASLGTLIEVASYIQAHQSGWGWLGWIMGVICVIAALGAAISILVGAGKIGGGKFSFFVFLVGCGLTWWFHGTIGSLFTGLFHNLRGADWGNWGYVPGGFIGLIAAGIVGGWWQRSSAEPPHSLWCRTPTRSSARFRWAGSASSRPFCLGWRTVWSCCSSSASPSRSSTSSSPTCWPSSPTSRS
jgi:hypothetical protein